jgi:hypothetical protein
MSEVPLMKRAVGPVPEKRPTNASNPPDGTRVAAAFVPPPKPYVWRVTLPVVVRVRLMRTVSSGVDRVPISENIVFAEQRPTRRNRDATPATRGRENTSLKLEFITSFS